MVTSLILGVNGQDGSYLAEELLDRGDDLTGVGRQTVSRWVNPNRFRYVPLDIADYAALDDLLDALRPERILSPSGFAWAGRLCLRSYLARGAGRESRHASRLS